MNHLVLYNFLFQFIAALLLTFSANTGQ